MLEAEGITVVFERDGVPVPALQQVSLSVLPGELVAVIGANGSGKTTLGRALCGMQQLAAGRVLVDGRDLAAGAGASKGSGLLVGSVSQHPRDQIVAARVYDEVAFGPKNLGLPAGEVDARVAEALAACELAGFEERLTSGLSGGEEQRLALAGALAMRPRFLVLDEPSAHLDAEQRPRLRALVRRLARERNAGVVVISHDAPEVLDADRVYLLEAGSVRWQGAPAELRQSEPELWRRTLWCPAGASGDRLQASQGGAGAGRSGASEPPCSARQGAALKLEGVGFSYGERRVLDGVDLEAKAGRVLLLHGPSGSGKSTAAALAAGLLEPQTGRVTLGGEPVRPGAVGLAFQNPEQQFFWDTVFDEVAFAPRNLGCTEEQVAARVAAALAAVGLDESYAGRDPFALSGGQARRVALASVLALDARAYLLDEPTAGLDVEGRLAVHRLVRRLARDGRAVVVISHDLGEWRAVADDAVELAARPAGLAPADRDALQGGQGRGAVASKLDARVKLAWLLAATAALFLSSGPVTLACWAGVLVVSLWGSGLRLSRALAALRPASFALALVFCANLVRCDGSADGALLGAWGLSSTGALLGLRAVLRIFMLVVLALEMAATTTVTELADACVRVLRPLARVGVPVEALGSALSMALRFVPLVGEEYRRIRLAQRARGVDVEGGSIARRARAWVAVFAPLIIGLFRRADRLAQAMAARGYSGAPQVAAKPLERGEWLVLVLGLLLLAAIAAA